MLRRILLAEDSPEQAEFIEFLLQEAGYHVELVGNGREGMRRVRESPPDLVITDIVMPEMDGITLCRRIREYPITRFLPVIVVTSGRQDAKLAAIEAGADDFLAKPFSEVELLARVKSLLRVKEYHDTMQAQAAEFLEWNRRLEEKVQKQLAELEREGRLKRYLPRQLAELILSSGDERILESHRSEIAVMFCDLRRFTAFSETAELEEVTEVLRQYHEAVGPLISGFDGTLEHFAGDGLLVFFNDPLPCPNPVERAVRLAVKMRNKMDGICTLWKRKGHDLDFGVGIAFGYSIVGQIGFKERYHYGAIGAIPNLAARLSGEARGRQIIVTERVYAAVEPLVKAQPVGPLPLKGFLRPVPAYNVTGLKE